jgi:NAD(P)-dependent dehydrogenase (short-subunit alcohol dehydrogenase family)
VSGAERALVTGGASGIGAATAQVLAERGYAVVVADVNQADGRAVAERVGGEFRRLDVSDPQAWSGVGAVGAAVLCAGVMTGSYPAPPGEWTQPRWERLRGVNIDGVLYGVRALSQEMIARGSGSIVVLSSMSGLAPLPNDPLYSASKHFGIGLVRSLAPYLGAHGVRINAMCPSTVATPLVAPIVTRATAALDPREVALATAELLLSGANGAAWTIAAGAGLHPFEFTEIPLSVRPGARADIS